VSYWQTSVIMFIPVSRYFYFCLYVILSCKFLCILSFFCNCYVSLIIDFVLYLCKREGHNWLLFIRSFIVCLFTVHTESFFLKCGKEYALLGRTVVVVMCIGFGFRNFCGCLWTHLALLTNTRRHLCRELSSLSVFWLTVWYYTLLYFVAIIGFSESACSNVRSCLIVYGKNTVHYSSWTFSTK